MAFALSFIFGINLNIIYNILSDELFQLLKKNHISAWLRGMKRGWYDVLQND